MKIALITNGIDESNPNILEEDLKAKGHEVVVFDVRNLPDSIDFTGFNSVIRNIMGGKTGDTEESWKLQKKFVAAGAKAFISEESARLVTVKSYLFKFFEDNVLPHVDAKVLNTESTVIIDNKFKPPFVVRKDLGSGKSSIIIAKNGKELADAVEQLSGKDNLNVIIHTIPESKRPDIIPEDILNPTHYRIVVANGKVAGAFVVDSGDTNLALNSSQGANFVAISISNSPQFVRMLARDTADKIGVNLAGFDITFDGRIIDVTTSPDLSLVNHRGESLAEILSSSLTQERAVGRS